MLCCWARHVTLKVLLSTQEYKGVLTKLSGKPDEILGVICDGLASHPGSCFMVIIGTSKLSGKPDKMLGGYRSVRWTSLHPIQALAVYEPDL